MGTELSYKTAVCTEYERLLFVCVKSRDSWKNRREEIANLGLKGKEVGDELLRLQADYAKAHSRLEKQRQLRTLPVRLEDRRSRSRKHINRCLGQEAFRLIDHRSSGLPAGKVVKATQRPTFPARDEESSRKPVGFPYRKSTGSP